MLLSEVSFKVIADQAYFNIPSDSRIVFGNTVTTNWNWPLRTANLCQEILQPITYHNSNNMSGGISLATVMYNVRRNPERVVYHMQLDSEMTFDTEALVRNGLLAEPAVIRDHTKYDPLSRLEVYEFDRKAITWDVLPSTTWKLVSE